MEALQITPGVWYVRIPEHDLYFLCGTPADAVKHLMRRGVISERTEHGISFEIGPNAILLSDLAVQNGGFSNLAEFPILQMFYRQGIILPGHPNNKGVRPLVVGHSRSVSSVAEALFRGTYGLANENEILEAGVPAAQAREILRQKLWFSFGSLRKSEELLDLRTLDNDALELRPGLLLRRTGVNHFSFESGTQIVSVDLNLPPGQTYEPAFRLGRSRIRREYFSVVHLGEGDGWDTNRPCMGSLLQFQGRNYLIDAGPHILESLEAVGLGLSEIEGVFQTHGHDDHFAGLPTLAMGDHRLKFFSTRLVRVSVMKKMAALMGVPEKTFAETFEYRDLEPEVWNDVEGLMVRPSWSPHPVETNVYSFRALGEDGFKTYCHWADIADFDVLRRLLVEAPGCDEASKEFYSTFTRLLLEPAQIKKIDIGGGMIHGRASDFLPDGSDKLVLAHIARPPTLQEKEIGSFVDFGVQDVLIPARQDYRIRVIHQALSSYFPETPPWERELLLNGVIRELSPGTVLQRRGEVFQKVLLVVGGILEAVDGTTGREVRYTCGALVGELHVLTGRISTQTLRARNFATVLEIPQSVYTLFTRKNIDVEEQLRVAEVTMILQETELLGDSVSTRHLATLARTASRIEVAEGQSPYAEASSKEPFLFLVEDGELVLEHEGVVVETVGPGGSCGEESLFLRGEANFRIRAVRPSKGLKLPALALRSIPIVGWKLLESYERRLTATLSLLLPSQE